MTDVEASREALARTVKRVFPSAKATELWRGIQGWSVKRPARAVEAASTGNYDPARILIGFAPRKTGLSIYYLDPGDYYALETHAALLAADGLSMGRGCIYWTRKGVLPTAGLEALFRAVKARDAAKKPKPGKAVATKAAAARRKKAAGKKRSST